MPSHESARPVGEIAPLGREPEPLPQKTAFLFSGQGIPPQEVIGSFNLLQQTAEDILFRHLELAQAASDIIIGPEAFSFKTDVFDQNAYKNTAFVQLITHALNLASWEATRDKAGVPVVMAGHSVGEAAALVAAGVLDENQSYAFVAYRGMFMQQQCNEAPSTIYSVEGLTEEQIREASAASGKFWVGLFNAPGTFGVGVRKNDAEILIQEIEGRGGKATDLETAGAFHTPVFLKSSRQMEAVATRRGFAIDASRVPVISNANAKVFQNGLELFFNTIEGIAQPVQWSRTIAAMKDMGVNHFITLGPGHRVLSVLNGRNGVDRRESISFTKL